jgi:ATP-dependent exoDNAse (exonuclease V) beta subunit
MRPEDGAVFVVDYKRCVVDSDSFQVAFGKRFAAPLDGLPYHKSNKWALQINVYREILERIYGLQVAAMSMLVCLDGVATEFPYARNDFARTLITGFYHGQVKV